MNIANVCLLIFLITLTACHHVFYDTEQSKFILLDLEESELRKIATGTRVFDGDPEPKYPENADATLEGIDTDKDGVRDDVEIWINENFKTANERRAFKQYAWAMGDGYQFLNDRKKSIAHSEQVLFVAGNCTSFIYGLDNHAALRKEKKVKARFYNTRARLEAREKGSANYRGQSGGTAYSFEEYDQCCKFKLENLEELKTKVKNRHKGDK